MSVATKARALVSRAAAAISMEDQQAKADAAKAVLIAAQEAYEEALGRVEIGEGTEEAAEEARVSLEKAQRASVQANAGVYARQVVDDRKAAKAAADRESAAWIDAKRLADERVVLIERYVADCKRIEATVRDLESVSQRLDDISPRRKAAPDLRGMIGGKQQLDRLLAIMKGLIPSLHRQPGMLPHEKGVEHFIKNELGWSRVFGDRNFKGGE